MLAMRIHELKTNPGSFHAILTGTKTFEVRRYDRDFQNGDLLRLREIEEMTHDYTGREIVVLITFMQLGKNYDLCHVERARNLSQVETGSIITQIALMQIRVLEYHGDMEVVSPTDWARNHGCTMERVTGEGMVNELIDPACPKKESGAD